MARKAIVSRTVESTQVTVLGMDVVSAEPQTKTYILPGTFRKSVIDKEAGENGKPHRKKVFDKVKLLKAVQTSYDTEEFRNIEITDIEPVTKLYGMWEEDFLQHAMELDPMTRKPN